MTQTRTRKERRAVKDEKKQRKALEKQKSRITAKANKRMRRWCQDEYRKLLLRREKRLHFFKSKGFVGDLPPRLSFDEYCNFLIRGTLPESIDNGDIVEQRGGLSNF